MIDRTDADSRPPPLRPPPPPPPLPPAPPEPGPWEFWATIGFSCLIIGALVFSQSVVIGVFVAATVLRSSESGEIIEYVKGLQTDGFMLSLAVLASAPFIIGLSVLFAKIRRGMTVRRYLCLHPIRWQDLAKWSLAFVVFLGCCDGLTVLLGLPVTSEFMIKTYQSARFVPLMWLAFVVVAPVAEELLFRGFMFHGIEKSQLGAVGAVVICSLAWTLLHLQYGLYGLGMIFTSGILLGAARARTRSVHMPIVMHVIQNLAAMIQVTIHVS
jgi:membrane protease YdiL (CAAX protease family)